LQVGLVVLSRQATYGSVRCPSYPPKFKASR